MVHLFSPFRTRDIELKNRIVVSPMCEYSSEDGFANDWHFVHLGSRAVGGASLVFTEATAVSPEGRISPADLGIWKEDQIEYLQRITGFIHQQGSIAGMQLAHAGRKASHMAPWEGNKLIDPEKGGWKTFAPSPLPFSSESDHPIGLDEKGIEKVITDFKTAAGRAFRAGFRVIEIHAAHGYLINEFLSPLSNRRTDKYGGSFENRIRFLLGVVAAVRSSWPDRCPLFVRISASDWTENGWTLEDSIALAEILKTEGVDLVDCSSGGIVPGVKIPTGPGYQVPFSEAVRKQSGIATGAVGMILNPGQAESIIANAQADLVFLAREMLRDPYFPLRAARELGYDIPWPRQYERAKLKPSL
jgi:2,4-dienoyl-CoA reductase-like NADH-dependent reductase (Old Yellow Enzyme family)